MQKVKFAIISALLFFISLTTQAQDQLRLKTGIAHDLGFDKKDGVNMLSKNATFSLSGIGLEYYRPVPEKRKGFFLGAAFEEYRFVGKFNPEFHPKGYAIRLAEGRYGTIRVYTGIEKVLNKIRKPSSNTISAVAGAALAANVINTNDWEFSSPYDGPLTTGEHYETFSDGEDHFMNMQPFMEIKRANLLNPEFFAGLRWNIKNKQAKTVLITEGIINYSPLPKIKAEFPYKLDGAYKVDKIGHHGFNFQMNALVPLRTFSNRLKK